MTGRCLLCSGTSASFANLEPSWSDLAPAIAETFFSFLRVPQTPEFRDTFKNSAYCDSCFEHVVELYEIMNQLTILEGSLLRVHTGIERSIRSSFTAVNTLGQDFQVPIPETDATICLRYKLFESITPEPALPLEPPDSNTITLYAASPGLPCYSDASIQCEIKNDLQDSYTIHNIELPILSSNGETENQCFILDSVHIQSSETEAEIIRTPETDLVIDRALTETGSGITISDSAAEFDKLVISLNQLESHRMEILPKQVVKYSEPEPEILDNQSSEIPDADTDTEEEWRPKQEHESNKTVSDKDISESPADQDLTAAIPETADEIDTNSAKQDYSIEAVNLRVNPRSSYIGSLFKCPYSDACKTWLKSEEDIRFHILRHHEGVKYPYKCDQCDKAFEFKNSLKTHYMLHTGERPFVCEHCGFACRASKHLKEHMTMHTGNKRYNCDICKKGFMSQLSYQAHLRSHTKERPYICEVCGEGFITNQCLKNHQTKHNELPYGPIECKVCGKQFATQHNLKSHSRRHNNQYEVYCPICNKGCDNTSQLDRHLVVHSKERKFACDQCSKTYLLKCHLTSHMKRHANNRAFECDVCSKKFYERKALNTHVLVHSGDKPYECVLCPKKFAAKTHLDVHYYSHRNPKPTKQREAKAVKQKSNAKTKSKEVLQNPVADTAENPMAPLAQEFPPLPSLTLPPILASTTDEVEHLSLDDLELHHDAHDVPFLVSNDLNLNNSMLLSDSIHSIVQELNAFQTENIMIGISDEHDPNAFSHQVTQALEECGPGITLQCNADGVVEYCTFNME